MPSIQTLAIVAALAVVTHLISRVLFGKKADDYYGGAAAIGAFYSLQTGHLSGLSFFAFVALLLAGLAGHWLSVQTVRFYSAPKGAI